VSNVRGPSGAIVKRTYKPRTDIMRKIVNATCMTLDGGIENMADWRFDYFGEDAIRAASRLARATR
jgi:hypothetical protein